MCTSTTVRLSSGFSQLDSCCTAWVQRTRIYPARVPEGARGRRSVEGPRALRVRRYPLQCLSEELTSGIDGKKKVSVSDPLFYTRLKRLVRIVIPSPRSREAVMLALHSAFLVLRTGLSLYVADLDGRSVYLPHPLPRWTVLRKSLLMWSRIVSTLVTNQPHLFLKNIAKWLAVAIPATFTNSMLEYLQSELGLAYRTRYFIPAYLVIAVHGC